MVTVLTAQNTGILICCKSYLNGEFITDKNDKNDYVSVKILTIVNRLIPLTKKSNFIAYSFLILGVSL